MIIVAWHYIYISGKDISFLRVENEYTNIKTSVIKNVGYYKHYHYTGIGF